MAKVLSVKQQMTYFPKHPLCDVCNKSMMQRKAKKKRKREKEKGRSLSAGYRSFRRREGESEEAATTCAEKKEEKEEEGFKLFPEGI